MIIVRTVIIADPLARANVVQMLAGAGAPVGVTTCTERAQKITYAFDDERTAAELIDALVEIARHAVPGRGVEIGDRAAATAIAARGLSDPDLDPSRIIETYLP